MKEKASRTIKTGQSEAAKQASQRSNMSDDGQEDDVVHAWKATEKGTKMSPDTWAIDSACSAHLCRERNAFKTLNTSASIDIVIADGSSMKTQGRGTARVRLPHSSGYTYIQDAYYVPGLDQSLLSVRQLDRCGMDIVFSDKKARIIDRNTNQLIGVGRLQGHDYILVEYGSAKPRKERAFPAREKPLNDAKEHSMTQGEYNTLIHRRLGHFGVDELSSLHEKTTGLVKAVANTIDQPCQPCIQSKMIRIQNRASSKRASRPLQRVFIDFWGPYYVKSLDGKRYFFTILDQATGRSWVYTCLERTEVYRIFKEWKAYIELQSGYILGIVRCDNAQEFIKLSEEMQPLGVLFEWTTPYTAEQNGPAERLNRTLVSITRSMLIDARLPQELWSYAVLAANYVRNHMPYRPTKLTPMESWSKEKPSIAHLRVWGCLCYTHIPRKSDEYNKLDVVSKECIFLGYEPTYRQYLVLDMMTMKTRRTSHVEFFESKHWRGQWNASKFTLEEPGEPEFEETSRESSTLGLVPNGLSKPDSPTESLSLSLQQHHSTPAQRKTGASVASDDILRVERSSSSPNAPIRVHNGENVAISPSNIAYGNKNGDGNAVTDDSNHIDDSNEESSGNIMAQGTSGSIALTSPVASTNEPRENTSPSSVLQLSLDDENQGENRENNQEELPPPRRSGRTELEEGKYRSLLNARMAKVDVATTPTTNSATKIEVKASKIRIPHSYEDAVSDAQWGHEWKYAIDEEIRALLLNDTFKFVKKPKGASLVSCKWVYSVKTNDDGTIDRFKARLVARGFTQELGLDYTETFSPTVRKEILRMFFAICVQKRWQIHTMDVDNAFVTATLQELIYMTMPKGINTSWSNDVDMVCILKKGLYGLKQSAREFYRKLKGILEKLGFVATLDPALFINHEYTAIIAVHVDDLAVAGASIEVIDDVKSKLKQEFKMKDLGFIRKYLGIRVEYVVGQHLKLDQEEYTLQILDRFRFNDARPVSTPCDGYESLKKAEPSDIRCDQKEYQEKIGSINYLAVCTRLDIAWVTNRLSQYLTDPTITHSNALNRVLRYLIGTTRNGLVYTYKPTIKRSILVGHSDSSFASLPDRKSVYGYVFTVNGTAISWASIKQSNIVLSTTEAEYTGLSETGKESIFLQQMFHIMDDQEYSPVKIMEDNQGANALATNPEFHKRSKHIDIRYHHVRQLVETNRIKIEYIASKENPSDMLTKPLLPRPLRYLMSKVGQEAVTH